MSIFSEDTPQPTPALWRGSLRTWNRRSIDREYAEVIIGRRAAGLDFPARDLFETIGIDILANHGLDDEHELVVAFADSPKVFEELRSDQVLSFHAMHRRFKGEQKRRLFLA